MRDISRKVRVIRTEEKIKEILFKADYITNMIYKDKEHLVYLSYKYNFKNNISEIYFSICWVNSDLNYILFFVIYS
ncbi:MAG: hypothetical protein ACTSPI_17045 [Candidatus Heimdallarchaeaceae archaeon]